jgi:SagB-type dehydrogenase family enzyme
MRKSLLLFLGIAFVILTFGGLMFTRFKRSAPDSTASLGDRIKLPEPVYESDVPVEQALLQRRSVRDYTDRPVKLTEASQLLWAAQGITRSGGKRTAPSAGALYPLEVYLVVGEVSGLSSGVYKYLPSDHELVKVGDGDRRADLITAALSQESIEEAPAAIVITAIYERTTVKYGERGIRYVHMEVGSAAQNVYLQAVSLDLGTVFIGAFHDQEVKQALNLPADEQPLCIMPVGRIK